MTEVNKKYFLIFILIFNYSVLKIHSQIFAPSANYSFLLSYKNDTIHFDSVFVYYSPDKLNKEIGYENNNPIPEGLIAKHSKNNIADFKWYRYNNNNFELIKSEASVKNSLLNNIYTSGCYRVEIRDTSDSVEIYTAWVFIDLLKVYAYERALTRQDSCDGIILDTKTISTDFIYTNIYDTINLKKDTIKNELNYKWSTREKPLLWKDKTYAVYPSDKEMQNDSTRFYITVTDYFKHTRSANYLYKCRIPWANSQEYFEIIHSKTLEENGYFAPDSITVINKGLNVDSVMWLFNDTGNHDFKDNKNFITEKKKIHIYYYPGNYEVKVISKNKVAGCLDSFSFSFQIMEASLENIPNVFTPNQDNINDVWIVKGKSIKYFRIIVYDRWGKVVFKKEQDNNTSKELVEWDGTLYKEKGGPNSIKVPSGVYFYIIEAKGYDGKVVAGKNILESGTSSGSSSASSSIPGSSPSSSSKQNQKKYKYAGVLYIFRE
jgi:gliding motility-associated-like protein